jgi:ABC-type lipoprotein export system ATPase subunit
VNQPKEIAKVVNTNKPFKTGDTTISVLNSSIIRFHIGELELIIVPSGLGKITLLSILGCVTYLTQGQAYVNSQEASNSTESMHSGQDTFTNVYQEQIDYQKELQKLSNAKKLYGGIGSLA